VQQQNLLLVSGIVLIAVGAILMAEAVFGGDGGGRDGLATEDVPATVAGNTASVPPGASSPSTDPPITDPPVAPRSFTLAATGDLLAQSAINERAATNASIWGGDYDFRPMFEPVRPLIEGADLALCHLETPLARPGTDVLTGDVFNAPHELAVAIEGAGYDGCSTASNRAFDMGADGVAATLDELDFRSIGHAGTARSADEAATLTYYEAAGVPVAHLAYTVDVNEPVPEPYLVNLVDTADIAADARAARASGAQAVIVSVHWGEEFTRDPTAAQQQVAAALADVPEIDLVVGHHAHVVQPITRIGDLPVAFGLGNFLSDQHEAACCPDESQDGVILHVRFVETGPATGEFTASEFTYTPTRIDRSTHTITALDAALADPALDDDVRAEYEESRARTDAALNLLGPIATPRTP
jgi:poly-gamma-glutamate capsule biosynthesis protein CapA/YwtB (metallophosphatase superfamily)